MNVEDDKIAKKIAEKVHKLMRLAESAAGTPEGDVAAAQARRLMEQHVLSAADLANVGDPLVQVTVETKREGWRPILANAVGKYNGGFVLMTGSDRVHFYGRRSVVQVSEYLFTYIMAEIERLCDTYMRGRHAEDPWGGLSSGEARRIRNGFKSSAAFAVCDRLNAMSAAEVRGGASSGETAMVLVRGAEAEKFALDCSGGRFGRGGSSVSYHRNSAGHEAGRNLRWNDAVEGRGDGRQRALGHQK